MLAHAKVVVGAPDRDLAPRLVIVCAWKRTAATLKIGENPVIPFGLKIFELSFEFGVEIHFGRSCHEIPLIRSDQYYCDSS